LLVRIGWSWNALHYHRTFVIGRAVGRLCSLRVHGSASSTSRRPMIPTRHPRHVLPDTPGSYHALLSHFFTSRIVIHANFYLI